MRYKCLGCGGVQIETRSGRRVWQHVAYKEAHRMKCRGGEYEDCEYCGRQRHLVGCPFDPTYNDPSRLWVSPEYDGDRLIRGATAKTLIDEVYLPPAIKALGRRGRDARLLAIETFRADLATGKIIEAAPV